MKDGYQKVKRSYYNEGQRDAEKGESTIPFPEGYTVYCLKFNDEYVRGWNERRAELGAKFRWAGK